MVVQPGESCDDGNGVNGDGCNADCSPSAAVVWTYQSLLPGDDSITGVAFGANDGIFVGGMQSGEQNIDKWAARFKLDGSIEWSERYDAGPFESIHGIAATKSMIYAVGASESADGKDVWVAGIALDGKLSWEDAFSSGHGADYATGVAALAGGDAVVAGVLSQENSPWGTLWVRRYAPEGSAVWTSTLPDVGAPVYALGPGISGHDERVVVGFSRFVSPAVLPEFLIAYPMDGGAPLWMADIPDKNGTIYGVAHAADGSLLLSSRHESKSLMVRRMSSSGETVQWSSLDCVGGSGRAIAVDAQGDVVVLGDGPGEKGTNIRLCKFSPAGVLRWGKDIDGGFGDDRGFGLAIANTDRILVGGSVTDDAGRTDAWLAMYSP